MLNKVGSRIIIDVKSLRHIFNLEFVSKAKGFHHDYLGKFLKKGLIRLEGLKKCSKTGAYVVEKVIYEGRSYGRKTFFPSNWTRDRVVRAIHESLKNANGEVIEEVRGALKITSFSDCGLKIESIIENGRLMTAYPVLKHLQ